MALKRLPRRLRHGEEATLVEHLGELRTRLLVGLAALALGFAVSFAFHEQLIEWLSRPLPRDRRQLVTFGVTEPFLTSIKVSLYAGFVLALPVILWQIWSFLAPALEEGAQRVIAVFTAIATALFAGGLAFSYFVALPTALRFLTEYDSELYDIQIRASYYYSFASLVLVMVALVFELPIFILALVRLRVLTAEKLRRNRKIGYIAVIALAVLLPTVDPVTLVFESIPLLLLYEASIWLSVLMERRWEARAQAAEAAR